MTIDANRLILGFAKIASYFLPFFAAISPLSLGVSVAWGGGGGACGRLWACGRARASSPLRFGGGGGAVGGGVSLSFLAGGSPRHPTHIKRTPKDVFVARKTNGALRGPF